MNASTRRNNSEEKKEPHKSSQIIRGCCFRLQVSNTTREMYRRDCGDKLIEIAHSGGLDLWFVVKKELPASSVRANIFHY